MPYAMLGDKTLDFGIWIILLVISSAFHESAHAWVAYRCGDDTAKNEGRISLDPMMHISWIESIILPAFLLFASEGRFILGGAKPVPIVPLKLRNPNRDLALATLAGPVSNLILVVSAVVLLCLMKLTLLAIEWPMGAFVFFLHLGLNFICLNLILAFFNLIPIPPLDGSRIVRYLIPQLRELYDLLDQFGLVVLILVLMTTGIVDVVVKLVFWHLKLVLFLFYQLPPV